MKRFVLVGVVLMVLLGAGCEQMQPHRQAPDVYWVMIDASPNIFDPGVYHNGAAIGEIRSTETSPLLVTRLGVNIAPEYRELITTNTVFAVSAGRLTTASLGTLGEPVAPGTALLGFASNLSFQWFKTRNVFSRAAVVAADTAGVLFAAMDAGGQRPLAAGH